MKAWILDAKRTPIGGLLGCLKDISAVDLGVKSASDLVSKIERADVADVIVGNVLQAGQGMNPARQIALSCGLTESTPAHTVNRVCGSGMQAVISCIQAMAAGDGRLFLAGGIESMSRAPYLSTDLRAGHKLGNVPLLDSAVHDGLSDPFLRLHMGVTAENVAEGWQISREDQDAFALESHRRAARAQATLAFSAEISPVEAPNRKGSIRVTLDESVRSDASLAALERLAPVFKKQGGTVTAGNASGLSDGAAMMTLASTEYVLAHGFKPLAEIVSYAVVGVSPALMGIGPAKAIPLALSRAHLSESDISLYELNEAFAAQSIAVIRELNLDPSKVNATGGAIALGHPIGASGARVLVTLAHALQREQKEFGVASLCIGGGMGIATVIRNCS